MLADSVFIHDHALVESDTIGAGTRVWAFAPVMAGARIGRDCNVCDHTYIEGGVEIGPGAMVGAGAVVTADVPPAVVVVGNPARVMRPV